MVLSVIIPVYNEVTTIEEILKRVAEVPLKKEIIVVDDFSSDGTRDKLAQLAPGYDNLRIVYHKENCGKGFAIRTGLEQVTGAMKGLAAAALEESQLLQTRGW